MKSCIRNIGLSMVILFLVQSGEVMAQYQYSGNSYSNPNRPEYNYSGNSSSRSPHSSGNYNSLNDPYDFDDQSSSVILSGSGDPSDPNCDPLDPSCPIDDGLLFLLVGGLGYGLISLRRSRFANKN